MYDWPLSSAISWRNFGVSTDEELIERLRTDPNPHITVSSTFKDRATAERIANSVLNDPKNIKKIEN